MIAWIRLILPASLRLPTLYYTVRHASTMDIAGIAERLERVGYVVLEKPMLETFSRRLLARCQDDGKSRFHAAQIGRGSARTHANVTRGDVISWLDNANSVDQAYLAWMEELRTGLNAALYLGLFEFECHYAIYGAGAGYSRHSDVLQGSRNRIVSTLFYLNDGWQLSDGGELVLYASGDDSAIARISPTFGTMILFLSESFPHEVLMSNTDRRSIAGWFRVREYT